MGSTHHTYTQSQLTINFHWIIGSLEEKTLETTSKLHSSLPAVHVVVENNMLSIKAMFYDFYYRRKGGLSNKLIALSLHFRSKQMKSLSSKQSLKKK